uniref:B30.2/SPRY domain-containing protein n=1 Tax=Fundulus heteroclitus TaxID=8078 RepID=A0A3Q2QZY6_FUNHE
MITKKGCSSLASALRSNPSRLKELDLSYNHPGEAGVKLLTAGLEDPEWRLETLSCQLTIDTNTVSRNLILSEDNRKVTHVEELQSYPDHPDRFDLPQLLCRDALTGRCYWEVKIRKGVDVSVSCKGIGREGYSNDCRFGMNDRSWSLNCSDRHGNCVWSNNTGTSVSSSSSVCTRIAVYVDHPAGILSFYRVSSDSLIHLHTFNTTFTEPLYPGFAVFTDSSVTLC